MLVFTFGTEYQKIRPTDFLFTNTTLHKMLPCTLTPLNTRWLDVGPSKLPLPNNAMGDEVAQVVKCRIQGSNPVRRTRQICEVFRVKKCADPLLVCLTPLCICTHKNDHVHTLNLKIL